MLCPNVIEVSEDIAGAFSEFLAVNSFGTSAGQIVVSPLSPDPDWLPPLRHRIAGLANLCATWREDYPEIISSYLLPFTTHAATFGAFAKASKDFGDDVTLWTDALDALYRSVLAGRRQSRASAAAFGDHLTMIKTVEGLLNQSLATAWNELAAEEKQIVALATQIVRLQDRVTTLSDGMTGGFISSGKSYYTTAATISYQIMTVAEVGIPYLSIVTEIFTIGKMAYDLIVTDAEIADALSQIASLTVKASAAAQAAAMSKGVIQLINALDLQVTGLNDRLPALDQMWEVEAGKIAAARDAIRSGAVPSHVFDLVSMPAAAAGWNTLADLSRKAITVTGRPGKPVFLTNSDTKADRNATLVH